MSVSDDNKQAAFAAKNAGNEFYKKKQFTEALEEYSRAIELDPNDMTYYSNRAAVYFELKDYENCVKQCEKAIEVGRENRQDFKIIAKAYARMANAYHKMDDLPNAKTYFQKSLAEHRTPETLSKLTEIEKVLKEKERLAYINPDKALEEKTSGNECFTKGDYSNAIKHYTEAIKHNPRDAELFSNRAASYHLMSRFDSALNDSEECIRLDPNFVKGYIRKGYALIATKDLSKAQSAFEKALDIESTSSEAQSGWRMTFKSSSTQLAITETKEQMAEKLLKLIMDLFTKIIFKCLNDAKLLILEAFFKIVFDIIKHH